MNRRWQIFFPWPLMALLAVPLTCFGEIQGLPAVIKVGRGVHVSNSLPFEFPSTAPPDFPVRLRPAFHFDFDGWKHARKMEWESMRFPVELTNTSERPLYYFGKTQAQPTVLIFKRQNVMHHWQNVTFYGCGVGMCLRELSPGQTLRFEEFVILDEDVGEVYLEVSLYPSTKNDKKPFVIPSAVRVCR